MFTCPPFALLPALGLSVLVSLAPAHAENLKRQPQATGETLSRDHLRDLVQKGKILSLATLKAQVLDKLPGELIDVSADRDDGAIIYEFRILREGGQVTEVEVDAASGRIIEIENE